MIGIMIGIMIGNIFKLCFAHALGDMALQTSFMATHKKRKNNKEWYMVLFGHAIMNGGCMWIVTGNEIIGIVETIFHFLIDLCKSEGYFNNKIDQLLHFVCIIMYLILITG